MSVRIQRKNGRLLDPLRSVAMAAFVAWGLISMSFGPVYAAYIAAGAVGAATFLSPAVGVVLAIIAMSLPLLASDILTGAVFLIIAFASLQYLAQDKARVFLVIAAAFIGATYGPLWAVPVLAGYFLGLSEGALTAIVVCVVLQIAGILTGAERLGPLITSGNEVLISFPESPANLLTFKWIASGIADLDPGRLIATFTSIRSWIPLVLQPVLWAIAAAVSASIKLWVGRDRRITGALASTSIGVAALAVMGVIAGVVLPQAGIDSSTLVPVSLGSLAVAMIFAAASETLFAPVPASVAPTRPGSMTTEDADVDELLRLIATAEDQLANKHTTHAVVMLTDMKSFSKMTEEDGSIASAKTIQRHRDLLLPIITEFGGSGKSTGGDGLLAAFPSGSAAVSAAAKMQRTLLEHNSIHPDEREIIVRIGIADGEVVLDKGGRPFIGTALNLAARIMNLADGGQIFASRLVADTGDPADIKTFSHGPFDLKNIAESTEVVEILWADGQTPLAPGIRT